MYAVETTCHSEYVGQCAYVAAFNEGQLSKLVTFWNVET